MNRFADLPKAYDASLVEDGIYQAWEASGVFNPDNLPERNQAGKPYCIMMPPPNRTGTLHVGHATMLAIEDLLIRFHRMQGDRTLWIPGTDHAAIATQVKVEQVLIKGGMKDPRNELGREKFLEKVVEFAEESKNTINKQVRKMGSSCDWSRERYTLDADRNRAVNEMFRMMFEDAIIERGYRLVNWDPQFQTTLSDDEVLTKETTAKLLTFTYDKDFPIAISTTRPETKFGDVAVAVHPTDERYKDLVGKIFTPTFCGKKLTIKIIADETVDPTFGTGALGVTPAHSMIDAEMAERHGLETIIVIGKDARLLAEAGSEFAGLTVVEARQKIEAMLSERGLLQSVQEIPQNLPVAERGGAPVEQLPMRQWFVRVNKKFALRQDTLGRWKKGEMVSLKELMAHAVESKQTTIVPERFEKTYFHWINNLRDWCISRQIWFGHRIPVWYRGEEMQFGIESPGEGWEQDPDTLDTWFSSGMWSFSALGWPNKKQWEEHRDYHPNAVLETGYDILFFWVARMILMSSYAIGEVPFKDVYLHGLVRDEQGRKMSKSLGNVLDPLDLIPKYGTDAVRLSLLIGTTPGQDVRLSEEKIGGFRNFANKLWNISRFILMQLGEEGLRSEPPVIKTDADQWLFGKFINAVFVVEESMKKYSFSHGGEVLRDFTWNDLADVYLEVAKQEKGKEANLSFILRSLLKLWHPYMPFVTEYVWGLAKCSDSLIVSEWPNYKETLDLLELSGFDRNKVHAFEAINSLVTDINRFRKEKNVEANRKIDVVLSAPRMFNVLLEQNLEYIKTRIRASEVSFNEDIVSGWSNGISSSINYYLNISAVVDVEKELVKSREEISVLTHYVASLYEKIRNEEFLSKAPAKVIDGMKAKIVEAEEKLKALKERMGKMG